LRLVKLCCAACRRLGRARSGARPVAGGNRHRPLPPIAGRDWRV